VHREEQEDGVFFPDFSLVFLCASSVSLWLSLGKPASLQWRSTDRLYLKRITRIAPLRRTLIGLLAALLQPLCSPNRPWKGSADALACRHYDEARTAYEALAKAAKAPPAAFIGLSRCHESVGDHDKSPGKRWRKGSKVAPN